MPEPHQLPELHMLSIGRPGCAKCQGRMTLGGIAAGPKGFDLRTFACSKCGHSFTTAVASDPMNEVSAGWIAGELKPPK